MHHHDYRDEKSGNGYGFNVEKGRDYNGNAKTYTAVDNNSVFSSSPDSELFVIPVQRQTTSGGHFSDGARRLFQRLNTLATGNGPSRSIDVHHAIAEKKVSHHTGLQLQHRRWRPMGMYKSIALLIVAAFIFSHTYFGYLPESLSGNVSSESSFSQKTSGHGLPGKPRPRKGGWDHRKQKHLASDDVEEAVSNTGRHEIKNGLLKVNLSLPVSQHPIKQLIREAQTKWAAKNAKQSTTLKQAVEEYKRRHQGNLPPLGFDKWWKFVKLVLCIYYATDGRSC